MAKKKRQYKKPNKPVRRDDQAAKMPALDLEPRQRKPEQQYGPPFILLEDENKNTFEYRRGAWVAHPNNIAECRIDCHVKELAQKVNKMTRYEVRRPLAATV